MPLPTFCPSPTPNAGDGQGGYVVRRREWSRQVPYILGEERSRQAMVSWATTSWAVPRDFLTMT